MRDGKHVILVVDDDLDYLEAIRTVLTAHGFETVSASTAEEGLEAWRREKPDLVIVDLMMEEIDAGTSLVRRLRAEGNDVPVFMASSVGDDLGLTWDSSALGLSGLLQKPVDAGTLVSLIRSKLR